MNANEQWSSPVLLDQLAADEIRYAKVQQEMRTLVAQGSVLSDRLFRLFGENEEIKNRWGGMPPAYWRQQAREEIAAAA